MPPINRIKYLCNYDIPYLPLGHYDLLNKLKRFTFNEANQPIVISYTPVNSTDQIRIKALLDDVEIYREPGSNYNKIIFYFPGDKVTNLAGEVDFNIEGSEILLIRNDVYVKAVFIDGTRNDLAKVPGACGILNLVQTESLHSSNRAQPKLRL